LREKKAAAIVTPPSSKRTPLESSGGKVHTEGTDGLFPGERQEVEKDLAATYDQSQAAMQLVEASAPDEKDLEAARLLQNLTFPPVEPIPIDIQSFYPQEIPGQHDDADSNCEILSDIDMSVESMAEAEMFMADAEMLAMQTAEVSASEEVSLGTFQIDPKQFVYPTHQTAYIILLLCSCHRERKTFLIVIVKRVHLNPRKETLNWRKRTLNRTKKNQRGPWTQMRRTQVSLV
jgi:hypothetical protein